MPSGLGWCWDEASKAVYFLFEVADMTTDDDGNSLPAGARLLFGPCEYQPSEVFCEVAVNKLLKTGLPGMEKHKLTPLTLEMWIDKGYEESCTD